MIASIPEPISYRCDGEQIDFVPTKCLISRHRVDFYGDKRCIIRAGHRLKTYDLHGITLIYAGQFRFAGVAQW